MKNLSLFFLFSVGFFQVFVKAQVERDISVVYREERVNGRLFAYRLEIASGSKIPKSRKEQWFVNGKEVGKDEYEGQIDEAHLAQIRQEREKDHQNRLAHEQFKETQRIAVSKKLLKKVIGQIEHHFALFDRYELGEYIQYSPETIENEIDFTTFSAQHLNPARHYLTISDEEFSLDKAHSLISHLQNFPDKLRILFEDTVKHAISQCDDTERLKKLLEIIS